MKVVILAGGKGTRISEESTSRPKPMVEIGGRPILWHIMNIYAAHGFKDFLIACGYKSEIIKAYFHNFFIHNSDYMIDLRNGSLEVVNGSGIDWKVGVIDTGLETQTGGRIRRLRPWLENAPFMATYGDGVSDIDLTKLLEYHRCHGKLATVTAVRPPARFGGLTLDNGRVVEFSEKPQTGEGWINGGFFVFEPGVLDYIASDESILERDVLEKLALEGQLMAFQQPGFWQPMDTLREKQILEDLWARGKAPWKIWAGHH
jgi:glucose-1-phosphate cytidylyltransferase